MLQVVRWGESCTINAIIRTNYCQLYHQYCCCYYVRYWPMLQVDRRDHNPQRTFQHIPQPLVRKPKPEQHYFYRRTKTRRTTSPGTSTTGSAASLRKTSRVRPLSSQSDLMISLAALLFSTERRKDMKVLYSWDTSPAVSFFNLSIQLVKLYEETNATWFHPYEQ